MVLQPWMQDYCYKNKPGTLAEFRVVEAFANVAEPAAFDTDYIQCGIPFGVWFISGLDVVQNVYPTFAWSEESKEWMYMGRCFRWGRTPIPE